MLLDLQWCGRARIGGPERDRTADLLDANEALSQLSYKPVIERHRHLPIPDGDAPSLPGHDAGSMLPKLCNGARKGLEAPIFRLHGGRSAIELPGDRTIPRPHDASPALLSTAWGSRTKQGGIGHLWNLEGDLNSRPSPYEGEALPLSYPGKGGACTEQANWCQEGGRNPAARLVRAASRVRDPALADHLARSFLPTGLR